MPVNVKAIKREHPSPLLSLSDRVKNVGRAQEYKKRCFSRLSTKLTHLCMPLNVQTSPVNSSIRTTLNTYTFLRIAGLLTETSRSPPPPLALVFRFRSELKTSFFSPYVVSACGLSPLLCQHPYACFDTISSSCCMNSLLCRHSYALHLMTLPGH